MTPSPSDRPCLARRPRRVRPWLADREGTTAVEFALISIPLLLLLFGSMEFGRLLWTQSALNFAVGEAARCASVNTTTCGSASQIQNYAAAQISTNYVPASAFTATTATCGHKVQASFVYPFVITGLFTNSITLSAMNCLP